MPRPASSRLIRGLLLTAAVPLLAAAISPGTLPADLMAQGWRKLRWDGIPPAEFHATPSGGIRVRGRGQAAFIYRPLAGDNHCLTWRWRVDDGPPATDLTRRGGDDRAVALAIGFAEFGPQAGVATRARHAMAQAAAGEHRLPRSVLSYVWGGTGREAPGFFASPWNPGISRLRVLRPADAPRGQWRQETVDLAADWRAAFGGTEVPALREVVISTDSEDTGSQVDAQVEGIRLIPCT